MSKQGPDFSRKDNTFTTAYFFILRLKRFSIKKDFQKNIFKLSFFNECIDITNSS